MQTNRDLMIDDRGKFRTTSLFLEITYDKEIAVYTLKEVDYVYEGKPFLSLKRLYLDMADPTEYDFANEYLCGWRHWNRMVENKQLRKFIDEWREELEFKLRAKAVKGMVASAGTGNYQAIKWMADQGWNTRRAGRPSKEEIERNTKIEERIESEFSADVLRLRQG